MSTFHVKQNAEDFPLSLTELWDAQKLPYAESHWSSIKAPWELLQRPVLTTLIESGHQRQGQQLLSFRGLASTDMLLHGGELLHGEIRVEGAAGCTKGELRCYVDGALVEGACWIQAGSYFSGSDKISLGPGSLIQSGAYVEGPLSIGSNCEVRQGAYLRGYVLAGQGCVLGHSSEFKGAIMHDGAKAAHFAYVGDSILGADVNLGAGTKVSNLKIRGSKVVIPYKAQKFDTAMRKLGALLGDSVETGCNAVLNPGVILARDCCVYPAMAVRCGVYAAKSWLKPTRKTEKK